MAATIIAMEQDKPYVAPFIRRLMPNATEDEILAASENLRAYLMLIYDIFLQREAESHISDSRRCDSDARFEIDGDPPSTI